MELGFKVASDEPAELVFHPTQKTQPPNPHKKPLPIKGVLFYLGEEEKVING